MDENEFLQLLQSLLTPNTETVKAATAALNKKFYTSPQSLTALVHILTSGRESSLKQLAAVEARKLVPKHWASIPADQKPQIRNTLLQASLNEDDTLTRHSAARVISAIAKIDLEDGQWADLPSTLQQAAQSQNPRHREVGMYIIFTLMETLGDFFMENLKSLFALFTKTLRDPDSIEVRTNTMLSLSRVAMLLDTDEDTDSLKAFQDCIPGMVAVLKDAVQAEDEDHAMQSFEVFQTLLGCESALLKPHFANLVTFMMDMATQKSLDDSYRSQALSFMHQAVKYHRLKVQSMKNAQGQPAAPELTVKAMEIVTEFEPDDDPDDEDVTPARSALGLLDTLAASLPPSQVIIPLLQAVGPYVRNSNWQYRQAGMLSLGMCVEGAPDFIATQLKEILPLVLHLLEDQDYQVRVATLNCIARLADDLADEMGKEHQRIIPALIKTFDNAAQSGPQSDKSKMLIRNVCSAIDSLIEGLAVEDAAVYVPELVPRIAKLIDVDDYRLQLSGVAALGSVASAGESAFEPYFEQVMQKLGKFIVLKDSQDDLDLRGAACDSAGKIASAVGPEAFNKYQMPLMQASEEALHLDHPRLRETSYILWSVIAKVYEEGFEPYLEGVVKGLHDCLEQEEKDEEVVLGEEGADLVGQEVVVAGKKLKVVAATDDDDEDADIEGDDDDDDWDEFDGVTAVAMEKEIALEVIGDVLTHTRRKYLPYLQKSVELVLTLADHSYEGIRKAAIGTLWRAYACLWGLAEGDGMGKWEPGLPLKVQPTEDLLKLGNLVMTATLGLWQDEMDRSTVTDINRDLAASLKLCGPAMLTSPDGGNVVPQIMNQLLSIVTKRHPCQQDLGDEALDDELPEESSEYDWLVVETALDALVSLSAALGSDFAELWKALEKPVLKYASSAEAVERSSAVGTIADCVGNMGAAVTPHTAALMKVLLHRLGDEDSDTKANAAYGAGLLCEKSDAEAEVLKSYAAILGKLEPMLHEGQNPRVLDNAAGCVARMIGKHPDKMPLEEILPRLLELLPLKEDYEENAPVYAMVVKLYQAGNLTMRNLTPQLKPVLEKVLGPPEEQLEDETRTQLLELVEYLKQHGQ